ncbi:MAG TPA: hypothetical protein VL098_01695 [Flavipsychrobacter sp.]|nr:hypothetical protein [Flavipsychrobacter sp.]
MASKQLTIRKIWRLTPERQNSYNNLSESYSAAGNCIRKFAPLPATLVGY